LASLHFHHAVARMILSQLKLVIHDDDLDLEPGSLQMIADRSDMAGPMTVQVQEREDAHFTRRPEQFFKRVDVEIQVQLLGVQKQEMGNKS
jgi:hypothetical protein